MKKYLIVILLVILLASCEINSDNSSKDDINDISSSVSDNNDNSTYSSAGVGETLNINGIKLTLESIEIYPDDGSIIYLNSPEEGNILLLFWLVAENTTNKEDGIYVLNHKAYCDGVLINYHSSVYYTDSQNIFGPFASNMQKKGFICFEIPKDWKELEFQYMPDITLNPENKFIFMIASSEIK